VGRQLRCAGGSTRGGLLHRDVKPSYVLLCLGGRTVLTDFGIATAEGDPSLTQAGVVMGSPGFLAPERIRDSGTKRSYIFRHWSFDQELCDRLFMYAIQIKSVAGRS
jgi:serine/threonine protein kinase